MINMCHGAIVLRRHYCVWCGAVVYTPKLFGGRRCPVCPQHRPMLHGPLQLITPPRFDLGPKEMRP